MTPTSAFRGGAIVRPAFAFGCLLAASLALPSAAEATAKLYWTDVGSLKIQRSNLDGTNVEDIITTSLVQPKGIAVDVAGGKLYWADAGSVRRSNLDGSDVEDLVAVFPTDIALDVDAGKMYWTEMVGDKIQRANLDGSGVQLLHAEPQGDFEGIALDVPGGHMHFISGRGASSIQRADLTGSNVVTLIGSGLLQPLGIALDPSAARMYRTDAAQGTIYRTGLTGNVPWLMHQSLNHPHGIALDVCGKQMYWTEEGPGPAPGAIFSSALDGTGLSAIVSGLVQPTGITVAPAVPVPSSVPHTLIARQGYQRGDFLSFGQPAINESGDVAFYARLANVLGIVDRGIFLHPGGAVAMRTDPAPGGGSYGLMDIGVSINAASDVTFSTLLTGASPGAEALVVAATPADQLIALGLLPIPGGTGVYGDFKASATNDAGEVAFVNRYFPSAGGTATGYFLDSTGVERAVALPGDAAPGTGGGTYATHVTSGIAINASGEVVFPANVENGNTTSGIFVDDNGVDRAEVLAGTPAPTLVGGTFANFGAYPSINDAGNVTFVATITGGTAGAGLFFSSSGPHYGVIALAGDSAPGTAGETFTSFGPPQVAGMYTLFQAELSGGGQGIFIKKFGVGAAVALSGQAAPGTGRGTYVAFGNTPSLNSNGEVAFYATLTCGDTASGIFTAHHPGISLPALGTWGLGLTGLALMAGGAIHLGLRFGASAAERGARC